MPQLIDLINENDNVRRVTLGEFQKTLQIDGSYVDSDEFIVSDDDFDSKDYLCECSF